MPKGLKKDRTTIMPENTPINSPIGNHWTQIQIGSDGNSIMIRRIKEHID